MDKALAGIERRLQAHNATVNRLTGVSPAAARKIGISSPGKAASTALSAEKAVAREQAKALREQIAIRNKINQLSVRDAQKEIRLKEVAQRKELRHVQAVARERSRFVQSTIGRGVERASGTIKAVGQAGLAMVGVGGAALAATAVASAVRQDEKVRRLIINAREGGQTSKYDPAQLTKQINNTAMETGVNPEDITTGLQAFVAKTGDLDTAVRNMKVFSQVSMATGASIESIAQASADLSEKMGIKDVDEMSQALATLTFQGKKGAFELRDMAQYFPEVSAAAQSFGIKGIGGVTQLGGMLQIARSATGSGAEAATSVEAMFRQLVKKSDKIQSGEAFGKGVSIFEKNDPTKPMRNFQDILVDMIDTSKGNVQQLGEVMDIRGIRAINPLISAYRDAGGGKAGKAAVQAKLADASTVKGDFGEIRKDAASAMQSFSVELEQMNTQFKLAISEELMPALRELAPELKRLVPYIGQAAKMFVDLVKFFIDHPFASLASVVAVQLAADFAKAQLGSLVGGWINKAFSDIGGGTATPVTGGGFLSKPGGSSMLGAAGMGAAMGITIGSAIISAGILNFEKGEADMKTMGGLLNQARGLTPADIASGKGRDILDQANKMNADVHKEGFVESLFGSTVAKYTGAAPNADVERKTTESMLAEIQKTLASAELKQAADALNSAAGKMAMNMPNRGPTPSPVK